MNSFFLAPIVDSPFLTAGEWTIGGQWMGQSLLAKCQDIGVGPGQHISVA